MLNIGCHTFTSLGSYFRILLLFLCLHPLSVHAQVREQWVTEFGTKVIFIQSTSLPMVDVAVDFVAGAAFDPDGKEGLSRLTMHLLDTGTRQYDEHAIAERLAMTGSQMGGRFDLDRAGITLRSLSYEEPLGQSVDLLTDILANPIFPQEVLDREINASLVSLRESDTRPASIASRALHQTLFGEHPYRSTGEGSELTIKLLTRGDLVGFHSRFYRAANAVITIVGDLNEARAREIAQQVSENLPRGSIDRERLAANPPRTDSEELVIPHEAAQAHIRIGMVGIRRGDPDHLPLVLANQILGGGGMTSILHDELREKRGMTYGVGSYFSPLKDPGPFVIAFQTRKDQAWEALEITLTILSDFIRNGPELEQVERAKKYFTGAFALNVDSNGELLEYYSMIGFYDLPIDDIDSFSRRVEAVTFDQVKDAVSRRMSIDKTVRIIVGPDKRSNEPNG
ncbi:MAG: pitrilysin family protein [Proteobacteria bacterium]|nr:pitrilysin family protein [Pseudomonadota bacterium]